MYKSNSKVKYLSTSLKHKVLDEGYKALHTSLIKQKKKALYKKENIFHRSLII